MATLTQTAFQALEPGKAALPLLTFEQFSLPPSNQRVLGAPHAEGTTIPLALRPSNPDGAELELDTVIETIKSLQAQGGILTKKLSQHGALLFRGLPVHNADDFSKFAHAFGYKPRYVKALLANTPSLVEQTLKTNMLIVRIHKEAICIVVC